MKAAGIFAAAVLAPLSLLSCGGGCRPDRTQTDSERSLATVSVAAASDLIHAFDVLIAEFRREHPHVDVQVTYGSSGNFFAQLSNKAPFDVFLSADCEYPRRLIESGHADPTSLFVYGHGQIALWVDNDSKLDLEELRMEALLDPSVRKIAIANPQHAPYGRAAVAALKTFRIAEQIQDRLVLGENIAQTAHFVQSGAADVGIVALSLATAPAMRARGRFWVIPSDSYPKLEQGGIVLAWAKERTAAETLCTFIVSERGRKVLADYGFLPSGE